MSTCPILKCHSLSKPSHGTVFLLTLNSSFFVHSYILFPDKRNWRQQFSNRGPFSLKHDALDPLATICEEVL